MKRFLKGLFLLSGLAFFLLAGAVSPSQAGAEKPMKVFVSVLPQKYFVKKIAGDLTDISVMVEPGASPAVYEPKPKQMADISKAKIYFSIGVPFEKTWLKKISSMNPSMKIVYTDRWIRKIPISAHGHYGKSTSREKREYGEAPSREGSGSLDHGVLDPHIWLSPPLVMMQARMILTALEEEDGTNRAVYEKNYLAFISELLELDTELRNIFMDKQGMHFIVFHPAWGYFADAYGLTQVPIEVSGKEPKPAQLHALMAYAKRMNIKVIFVQPEFSVKSANQVAKAIGGQVVFADPLAADWAYNIKNMAVQFKEALR